MFEKAPGSELPAGRLFARSIPLRLIGVFVFLLAGPGIAAKPKWDPIDPTDLAAKDSKSSPGADAEILFSRDALDTEGYELIIRSYIRAKIYTPKGVEERGKLNIEGDYGSEVGGVASRVIKADGTVIELKKADFMESTVVKWGFEKAKQVAFAFPNLAPGDIVEFQWERRMSEIWAFWQSHGSFCQMPVPVREYTFSVDRYPTDYQILWENCPGAELKRTKAGGNLVAVRNLPPFEAEADMPPEHDFRAWIIVVPNDGSHGTDEQWQRVSEAWDDEFSVRTRPGHSVKAMAAKLIAGATSDAEKIRRLYEFCQKEVVNFAWNDSPELQAAKRRNEEDAYGQSPNETLKKRRGAAGEIDDLFAALARAAGYEVKLARNASRTDLFNIQIPNGWNFLHRKLIAVRVGERWQYFAPGQYWTPFGMLNWRDEGVTALLCDPKKVLFEETPVSPAEMSQSRRRGQFTLEADGTLEGSVEIAMTGQTAIEMNLENWNTAADEIDRNLKEQIARRLPSAEVSGIHWDNLRSRDFPVTLRYHVRIPGYAEHAGKRLVLPPGYFVVGEPARFTAAKRKYPVFFPRAWADQDEIEIVLPEGFQMEQASAPPNVGDPEASIGATYKLAYEPGRRILTYRRHFALGAKGALGCRVENYADLKRLFEGVYKSDMHSIVLRRAETTPAQEAGTPTAGTPSGIAR